MLFHRKIFWGFVFWLLELPGTISNEVFGPGLMPHRIVMPARYFYVDLSSENSSYNESVSERLRVEVGGRAAGGGACRLWLNKLDRRDGSFIVRYRLYETCHHFYIHVLYNDQHIANSPYKFDEAIQADQCDCPQRSLDRWLLEYGCPHNYTQISADLHPFPAVNMTALAPLIVQKFHQPKSMSLCHYAIKSNKIYRKCYGDHVGFNMFSDNVLLSLARKTNLPDVEMFMNLGDWPLVQKNAEPALPVWSWCGSEDTLDIVLPTYDLTESTLENMGRVMLDILSVQGNTELPWSQRTSRAFWRGRDSRAERLRLADIARQHPDLLNVSLTNFFFYRDKETHYGKQPLVSFFKFFEYKYQINIDGTVAAYRMPYLLAGGSLVLKQDSPYYEHFYHQLEPYTHYLPFKRDLSDLVEQVRWAIDNDDRAKEIANNGRRFAQDHLSPHDVICYHAVLLSEWSKRLVSEVRVLDDMTPVPQSAEQQPCHCRQSHPHTEL